MRNKSFLFMLFFIKKIINNIIRTLFTWFIASTIMLGILSIFLYYYTTERPIAVKENSVLYFDLNTNITDAPTITSTTQILQNTFSNNYTKNYHLLELINAIEYAANDNNISCIFMRGSLGDQDYANGYSILKETREALKKFKESGKKVYAYLETPSMKDYFLMSIADELYANPLLNIDIKGLALPTMFYANAFEKYGIGVQVTRVGKYKSAVEPFIQDRMSAEDKEQLTILVDQIWADLSNEIASSRNIPTELFRQISETTPVLVATEAIEARLIDGIYFYDDVIEILETIAGKNESKCSYEHITMSNYLSNRYLENSNAKPKTDDLIAIVYATGDIINGYAQFNQIQGIELAQTLRSCRQNDNIKAVVLRVNSPGGAATASAIIGREVQLLAKEKNIVASIGSSAASGGYWICAYCNSIIIDPVSITGSIGVFGLIPNFEKISNNFGITWDTVKSSEYADILSMSRPKTDAEMNIIQKSTDFVYDSFINTVSEGRNLPRETVFGLAEGRVWTGSDALNNGLADELGGLKHSIQLAAEKAGLTENSYSVIEIPRKKNLSESISDIVEDGHCVLMHINSSFVKKIKSVQNQISKLNSFDDPNNVYARAPYVIEL